MRENWFWDGKVLFFLPTSILQAISSHEQMEPEVDSKAYTLFTLFLNVLSLRSSEYTEFENLF